MVTAVIAAFIGATVASLCLTRWVIAYANRRGMQDIPNARSMHERPTPRGGGLAIAMATLGGGGIVAAVLPEARQPWLLMGIAAGAAVATLGFLEDRFSLSVRTRLVAQVAIVAGVGTVLCVLRDPTMTLLPGFAVSGVLAIGLAVVYVVSLMNMTNFMDGIDGLAASQVGLTAACLSVVAILRDQSPLALLAALLAGACLGFLRFNWQPARIFMGDVGSLFIGFGVAYLSWWTAATGTPLAVALILYGVFIVDPAITLFRRWRAGEHLHQAHRDHAFQHAVQKGHSHARVTLTIAAINVLVLIPLAALALWVPIWTPWAIIATVVLLLIPTLYYQAGRRSGQGIQKTPPQAYGESVGK